jgi:hypothetical protein
MMNMKRECLLLLTMGLGLCGFAVSQQNPLLASGAQEKEVQPGAAGGQEQLFSNTRRQPAAQTDIVSLVGLTMNELWTEYTAPQSVAAVRGKAPWQDDVALYYKGLTLYIAQNRVWQIAVNEAFKIKTGDRREVVLLTMGDPVEAGTGFLAYAINDRPWPVRVRFGLNAAGRVVNIFIYRSDF